jgi:spore germination protein
MQRTAGALTHVVHGFHPYWIADSVADHYRWDLLSHLAYFSYEVDPLTGEPESVREWRTSTVIDRAKAAGVKVLLTVTNFGADDNRTLLSSPQARDVLITRLTGLLQERGAHGVNIDFEALPGDQRENLVSFFAELRTRLDAAIPGAVISAATPAVDWNAAWDVAALSASIDLFFVMCYDYSWSSSTEAGPVAPIRGMSQNVERTLRWYLDEGVPPSRLVMGVPYYGYDWPVESDAPRAATTGRGISRTYSAVAAMLATRQRQWSETYLNPWISYMVANWRQLWYDDAESLEYKYQLVKNLGIAGTGMWALGYDADLPELWALIERMFTQPATVDAPRVPEAFRLWPHPLRAGEQGTLRLPAKDARGIASGSMAAGRVPELYDLLGRVAAEVPVARVSDNEMRFIVPLLPPGIYVLAAGSVRARIVITDR